MEGTKTATMATPGNLGSSVLASKTKTKKKHFVAQKVKLFRASDPLLSVLMWGVNHSVSLLCGAPLAPRAQPSQLCFSCSYSGGRAGTSGWLARPVPGPPAVRLSGCP